uniref:Myb-like domain-containing protein n=2 Tax=Anthurium amnicola TaxID=1678845 RepID=A0A1D1YPM4_9ARAE
MCFELVGSQLLTWIKNALYLYSYHGRVKDWMLQKKQDAESLVEESSMRAAQIPILGYAVRFLKSNSSCDHPVLAEAPATPERICDAGVWGMPWEDQSSEESLFYLVPPGAMHVYRESVESRWLQHEKMRNTMHREDCEASTCDSLAEYGSRENVFEEDEVETAMLYPPGMLESNKSSKFSHKKKKTLQDKSYGVRSCEVRSDLAYGPYLESRVVTQPSPLTVKRPSSTFNVSIPTKRMRTASRQRVVSPFSAGNAGGTQVTSKTDVSSGDTSSFQDDQSSLQCGSQARKNIEIESTADFEKNLLFDGVDMPNRSKKKKKSKHMGYRNFTDGVTVSKVSSYDYRWQADPLVQRDQKDHMKKRLESHHLDSNGSPGFLGQHAPKKPKLLKQLPEASPESVTPVTCSIPSPAASQMSSMSNPSKLIKMIASRDRGRKNKALKITAGQLGSGGSWSQFEDQALVVLVHDMGPNWELVSDAINSTLQFKCIFRQPNECKERHRVLMEKGAGDGADSADDSGSSQSYPSTLPGIPKGGARQLFQRLQGPMEEDTLKAHFEKIILIGRQWHFRRNQCESKEMKQMTPVHSSHVHALAQACPNNSTGSPLMPLDFCEITPSPEAPLGLGYQGSHSNGFPMSTHPGALAPVMPTSGANSMLQGSSGLGMNSGLSSPTAAPIAPTRDSPRYGVPRPPSFPVDEQQRMQHQYGQMLSGRNMQQPSMPIPGTLPVGADRSVRMLSGGNSMGVMCGMNNGVPMARPGFQAIGSPGVLNVVTSGSMLPTGGVGMSNPVNIHSNAVAGQGNSLLRPRDHLQMQRAPQIPEDHKQMIMQELQLQVTQGNCPSVPPGNGLSAPFTSQGTPPSPIQTFSTQQNQQSHQMSQPPHLFGNPRHSQIQATNHMIPQAKAYAMRLAKERQQMQQRLLHQQPHFSGCNAGPPSQNSSQIQQQPQSAPVTTISSSQAQHKQQNMPRNPLPSGGMSNQMMNQRRHQVQQQPRHQQQRQPPQQAGNLSKGLGSGNLLIHQSVPVDSSHVNAPSTVTGNQVNERHLLQQTQGLYAGGSGSCSALPQSSSQQKIFSRPPSRSSKSVPPMSSHPDTCSQSLAPVPPNHSLMTSQQSSLPPLPLASQQQQRQTNHSQQAMQRMMLQQNHHMNSDGQMQSTVDQVQVNPMIATTSASQCVDPGNAVPVATSTSLSASHWKPEPSYDTTVPAPNVQLASSPQQNLVGTDASIATSGQGLTKRPFSGSLPVHVHGIGGQWQQPKQPQQQPPQDKQQQQHPPLQHQHHQHQHQHQPPQHQQQQRQTGQSALYMGPSNSGPG